MNAKVIGLATSPKPPNGERLYRVKQDEIELKVDHGIVGNCKAGSNANREVNLLAQWSYEWYARNMGEERTMPGGFGENIVISDELDPAWLDHNAVLGIGGTRLRVNWSRTPCNVMAENTAIERFELLNGRVGVLCTVLQAGTIKVGDTVTVE
ncbi:MAG: MOSC domain-containing protein [Planctomycetota bacterium]|jgi:MOSC domain-containing protein YiiM